MINQGDTNSAQNINEQKKKVQEDCFEEFMNFKDDDLDSKFQENPMRIKYWKEEWSDEEQKQDSLQRIKKALVTNQLMIAFLIAHSKQVCSEGCLKCSIDDECQICDVAKFYKLVDKKCVISKPDNCLLIDLSGNCLSCEPNYYIEPQLKKCIEIGLANRTENCRLYDSKLNCTYCDQGYFIAGSVCKVQDNPIENCMYYQDIETCLECKPGSIVSIDRLSCESTSSISNCLKFSKVKCNQCQQGYLYNELAYESQWFKSNSLFEKDKLLLLTIGNNFKTITKQYACQKQLVDNCEEFADLNTCTKCAFGFYLNDFGKCIVNPFPSIQNCEVYTSRNSCLKCKQTFYRQSEISCVKVKDIPNCALYSQVDNFSKCDQCMIQFYLNGTDKCIERENRVENCFEYEINLDLCKSCSGSFVLTDDKLNCLSKVDQCLVYKPSTFETTELQCYKCQNGYHLNGKICEKGTIDNCEEYSVDSTHTNQICNRCKNQFVLNGQICIQSQKITDCDIYHPHTKNACEQCITETQNILLGRICVDQPIIANCEVYQQTGTTQLQCQECGDGYYLTEDLDCSEIQIENCIQVDENQDCQNCKDGYFLTDNRCVARPAVHSFNCESEDYLQNQIFGLGCQVCKDNTFPLVLAETGICFESSFVPTDKVIQNCVQYDTDDNFRCKLCKEGFVRDYSNGKYICSQQCSNNMAGIQRSLDNINLCLTNGSLSNCQILAKAYDGTDICIKCKTGYIQVLLEVYDFSSLYTMTNTSLFFNLHDDLQAKNFAVSCTAENSVPSAQLTTDCQYYQYENSIYKCIKCKNFYTGNFTGNGGVGTCTRDNQFTEKRIYNLDVVYGIVQSGFECQDDLEIPWINVQTGAGKGLCSVDVSNLTIGYKNQLQNTSNFCANPNIIDVSFNIPQNCGTILTESTKNVNDCQLSSIQCLYCKPKFKPGYTSTKISSCVFIDHCIGDNWFNECSKCENGYSFQYINGDVSYDECVENSDPNCFVLDPEAETCKVCKSGYTLIKGVCEQIVPQKCKIQSTFQSNDLDDYYSSKENLSKALKFTQKYYYNCQDCQQGFTSIIGTSYNFCIESQRLSKLYTDKGFLESDYYIQNCIRYGNNMPSSSIQHTCQKCGDDLYAFQDECIQPLANCEVVQLDISQEKYCASCKKGYGLQGNVCVVSEVSHCKINQTYNTCSVCEQGYYLDNGSCLLSEVQNCEDVTGQHKCDKCFEGYLLYVTDSKDYCFPQPEDLDCKEGQLFQDMEFGAEVVCKECPKVNQLLLSDIEANFEFKSVCAPIKKIENCAKYNESRIFYIENFDCVECIADYYLQDNKCIKREVKVENCLKYSITQDKCAECNANFYKDEEKCVANPFGIQGCIIYESSDSCLQCESNKFSQDGLCYQVQADNKIENCDIYLTGTLCQTCASGYFLQDNTCIKSQLQNCLDFESATVCKQCADQYELKEEENKISCQKVEKLRCLQIDLSKENRPCVKCEFLFYVNQTTGDCDEVPKENRIDNCLAYVNERECEKCDLGYVLSKDKLLCSKNPLLVNQIPDNCIDAKEEELFCSICKGGYKTDSGRCVKCTENTWESGCHQCLSDYEGCYICRSGYIMNKDQKCVLNNSIDNNNEEQIEEVNFGNLIKLYFFTFLIILI